MASHFRFSQRHASDPGGPSDQMSLSGMSLVSNSQTSSSQAPSLSQSLNAFSFSRGRSRAGSIPEDDSWGPYGLNLLYAPPEPLVDLIFVHGLRGGSVKTWCMQNDLRLFWPQAWLPREPDLQNIRIHSFGYNSDWKDGKRTSLDVHDFGRSLFGDMSTSPYLRHDKDTRIVLIGHSMGGLVMKKAFLLAQQDPQARELADRIQAMFFLATPHRGSDSAKLLSNMLKASAVHSSRPYINDLTRNSTSLQIISDEFRMFADRLQLWSFYETLKTKISSSTSLLVVDRDSAVLGYQYEKVQLLNADHRGVCKFQSPSDPNYQKVRNSLSKAVESILGDVIARKADESRAMIGNLEFFLGIGHFAEDDLNSLQALQAEGSCAWIVDQPAFQTWRDSSDTKPLAYWLTGQPGSGKSVTSSHVIIHLRELGVDVCHYFFRHGHKEQQSASGFVRQLAYQMASQHPTIRQRLCALQEGGVSLDKDDPRTLWRRLFVNEILKAPLPNHQFWVIDGLDECPEFMAVFAMLSKIESAYPINLFFASRKIQGLERQFASFQNRLFNHTMQADDTLVDIRSYIQSQCDVLAFDLPYRHDLVDTMLRKSDGSFLWTTLAFEELEHVYSEDAMSQVLDEIPSGMSALYDRVLESMSKNSREVELTKAILSWTACAVRNLSVKELQAAMKLDLNRSIPNVERTVLGLCGQLVRVEQNNLVQLTHATVRDFLIKGCPGSPFAITRSETHERLARVCLGYLSGDELRPPRTRAMMTELKTVQSPFADYAAISWSDHLMSASSQSDSLLKLVRRFLESNVLSWIELVARRKKNLHHITRTARNLRSYLDRRAKYLSPLGDDFASVSQWATDLLRIVAKFGRNLLLQPSAIYFIVPPLCPSQSSIHKQFASGRKLLSLEGFNNSQWGDCISYIEHRDTRIMSIAGGDNIFAIGCKSGHAKVYHGLTCQERVSLPHGESVRIMQFDHASQHIVTSGNTSLKMWNVDDGHLLWSTTTKITVMSLTFSQNDQLLVACTRSSGIHCWRAEDGAELAIDPVAAENPTLSSRMANQAILSCSIAPDLRLVALGYRGRPPQIWSLEKDVLIGSCEKEAMSISQILFNPNPSIELLAVAYQDGDLALFNPWTQEETASVSGDAYMMAATPDGRTLATGDMLGTIKLWDFETLHLLYCIKSPDYGIRALAFSGDGLRLFDMRESKCKVWEPAALLRDTISDDSSISESAAGNEAATTAGNYGETIAITVMLVSHSSGCIFLGKDDGTVYAFDMATGTLSLLYSHGQDVIPTSISWNATTQHLATGDASSTLLIWRLEKPSPAEWKATSKVVDRKWSSRLLHIALKPDGSQILVVCSSSSPVLMSMSDKSITILPFPSQGQDGLSTSYVTTWRASSVEDAVLLAVDDVGRLLIATIATDSSSSPSTSSFQLLDAKGGHVSGTVRHLALNKTREYLVVDFEELRGAQQAPKVVVYETGALWKSQASEAALPIRPLICLCASEVRSLLGFCGTKLAFLDKRLWVRSYDLEEVRRGPPDPDQCVATVSEAVRHFFIPFELVGGNNGVDGSVTEDEDVVFPKEGELGIVRNALTWSI